jgi:vacuolar protein sorting-associated protein 52
LTSLSALLNGTIDETYAEYLTAFNQKLDFLIQYEGKSVKAVADVEPSMRSLAAAAAQRVHQFLQQRLTYAVRDLNTLHAVQKQMLKYRIFFHFLNRHAPDYATEIVNGYVVTVATKYREYFGDQVYKLLGQYSLPAATRDDLLGSTTTSSTINLLNPLNLSLPGFLGGAQEPQQKKSGSKLKTEIFSLSAHGASINGIDAPVSLPTTFKPETDRLPYDFLFRLINYQLMTSVQTELTFTKEFFGLDLADRLVAPASRLISDNVSVWLQSSFDIVGQLIMLCVCSAYKKAMNDQQDNALNQHWNTLSAAIATRLRVVFDFNMESMRSVTVDQLLPVDLRPHFLIKRVAEFLAAYLALQKNFPEAIAALKVQPKLGSIIEEASRLIQQMTARFNKENEKLVFMINQADAVITCAAEKGVNADRSTVELTDFIRILKASVNKIARNILQDYFLNMVQFAEQNSANSPQGPILKKPTMETDLVAVLVKEFYISWKAHLRDLNKMLSTKFINPTIGSAVLAKLLRDLVAHYKIFTDLVKTYYKDVYDGSQQVVPMTELSTEVRSYTKTAEGEELAPDTPR